MNRPHTNNLHPGTLDPRKPRGVEVPAFQRAPHTATVVHIGPCDCPPPSAWAGAGELAVGLTFLCLGVLLLAAGSTTAAAAGGALLAAALAAARDGLGQLERTGPPGRDRPVRERSTRAGYVVNRGRLTSLLDAVVGLALLPYALRLLPVLLLVPVLLVVLVVEHLGGLVTAALVLGVTVNVGLAAALVVSVVRDRQPAGPLEYAIEDNK